MDNPLSYKNEEDRTYGLTGMAVALAYMDALDRVASISLDSDGPMVTFSNEFYYLGSQSASPKAVRRKLTENYQLTSVLAVSNVLSRCYVHEHISPADELLEPLREAIGAEGKETLDLDDDEIEQVFSRVVSYSRRIFGNLRLHPLIDKFAGTIGRRRTLTGREIAEELEYLRML